MSEIKANKIKPALNPVKVKLKTGISVVDSAAPTTENNPFEINTQGQIKISTELSVGNAAGATTGAPGSVLLSRGSLYSATWGPIPSASCPPISDTGKIWGRYDVTWRRNIVSTFSACNRFFNCDVTFIPKNTSSVYEGISTDSLFYPLIWAKIDGQQGGSAGITVDGYLYTWGANTSGRVGNGSSSSSGFYDCSVAVGCPFKIGTQNNWSSVHTSHHWTVATKTDGTMWVWGSNHCGVYGDSNLTVQDMGNNGSEFFYRNPYNSSNSTIPSTEPVRLGTDTNWKEIFSGIVVDRFSTFIALKQNGTLWSWGGYNIGGLITNNLGYTPSPDGSVQKTPKQIGTDTDWKWATWYGTSVGYAIKTDGSLWGWGYDKNVLGVGLTLPLTGAVPQYTPIKISGPNYAAAGPIAGKGKWKKVVAFPDGGAGLQEDGTVWVWGLNINGKRFSLGPTNPITGNAWSVNNTPDGFLAYPYKLDNNVYIDIQYGNDGLGLIRADGTLWITGTIGSDTSDNGNVTFLLYPHQPNFSKSLIWSRFFGPLGRLDFSKTIAIGAIATEKIIAPTNSTIRWFRKGYTSLSNSCDSSEVVTASVPPPIAPTGWKYCDGTNGTVNMKSWFNPLNGKLDWPPVDNVNGCGNSTAALPGQFTYIQKT